MFNWGEKMLPEKIPTLKGKNAEKFEKVVTSPPDEKTIELFRKANEVYKGIRRV